MRQALANQRLVAAHHLPQKDVAKPPVLPTGEPLDIIEELMLQAEAVMPFQPARSILQSSLIYIMLLQALMPHLMSSQRPQQMKLSILSSQRLRVASCRHGLQLGEEEH